jgi:hypothetical protein
MKAELDKLMLKVQLFKQIDKETSHLKKELKQAVL